MPRCSPRHARKNFIDDLVLKKLEALRIPPSGDCTDAEFIRRVYLDAAGILPTPEEVKKFLADPRPDRRAKLVDALLERPEFVDYWSYKWSDMLLVSSRRLAQPAVWAFYQFIRQSVADNKPWDRFARDILTASGNNLQNGAANYFVLHKDVTDLNEATSVTFLGMSITCCRCHNHPLEKWTQDQYWGMANLFARVAIKNGERAGEVTVQAQQSGDVPHPRRGLPVPPTPLDAKPQALEQQRGPTGLFRGLADRAGEPVFRQGAGQSRLAELPGPRPGRSGRRPAANQSADQPRIVRCPGEGLHRPQVRCQAPGSYHRELGDLSAFRDAARRATGATTAFTRITWCGGCRPR